MASDWLLVYLRTASNWFQVSNWSVIWPHHGVLASDWSVLVTCVTEAVEEDHGGCLLDPRLQNHWF